jgi:preprotein translocase subunit SecD
MNEFHPNHDVLRGELLMRSCSVYCMFVTALLLGCGSGQTDTAGDKGEKDQAEAVRQAMAQEGGWRLRYEVHFDSDEKVDPQVLTDRVRQLVNPDGQSEALVRLLDADLFQIDLPGAKDADIRRIRKLLEQRLLPGEGMLSFRILAHPRVDRELIKQAESTLEPKIKDRQGKRLAEWVPISETDGSLALQVDNEQCVTRKQGSGTCALVLHTDDDVGGNHIASVRGAKDERGRDSIDIVMTDKGATRMQLLSTKFQPDESKGIHRQLGVIYASEMVSAPMIRGVFSKRIQITGNFSEKEINHIVNVLRADELPVSFVPLSAHAIGRVIGGATETIVRQPSDADVLEGVGKTVG